MTRRTCPIEERFWRHVEKTDTCWLWTGAKDHNGYGRINRGRVGMGIEKAHRASYMIHVGPIPLGVHIDHRCHVTSCVNPQHLRPVSAKQNQEHLLSAQRNSGTGIRGVSWDSQHGNWRASVCHNRRSYQKNFRSIADAECWVIAKRLELFTHNDLDRRFA